MPIIVGGNGPNVTRRLAARHADESNLDSISVDKILEPLVSFAQDRRAVGLEVAS